MTIETVVFGLDDTLVAAERAYARALSVLADYHIDPTTFLAAHRRLWARYQRGDCTIEELYQGRMRDAGLTGTAAAIAHDRFTSAAAAIRWRSGARHLLQSLRAVPSARRRSSAVCCAAAPGRPGLHLPRGLARVLPARQPRHPIWVVSDDLGLLRQLDAVKLT
jgi:beta-phosphoglucomutase-like phosphatase (HAD superfamily)